MKLNVGERLTLVSLVPEKGNFETMATVEKLKSVLYLSEEEVTEYAVSLVGPKTKWNEKGNEGKEVEISQTGMSLITKILKGLDEKEELTGSQYKIFKRIKDEQKE